MTHIICIHYQYHEDTNTRVTTWVAARTTMNKLPRKCGISSGRVFIDLLVNGRWVNQEGSALVVSEGKYKFRGTWKTKEERRLEKEDDERRKKARARQIERKRNHKAMLG